MKVLRLLISFVLTFFIIKANCQSCTSFQYAISIDHSNYNAGQAMLTHPDGSVYIGAVIAGKFVLEKVNSKGDTVWGKTYYNPDFIYSYNPSKIVLDKDSNLLCNLNGNYIVKLDTAGRILYTKQFSDPISGFILDFTILDNGDKLVLVDRNGFFVLMRLKADLSTIIWSKLLNHYDPFTNLFFYIKKIACKGDNIFIPIIEENRSGILKLSVNDGALLNQFWFKLGNLPTAISSIYCYDEGFICIGYLDVSMAYNMNNHFIIRFDNNLHALNSYTLSNVSKDDNIVLAVEPEGSFYAGFGYHNFRFLYASKADSILWARDNASIIFTSPYSISITNDGLVLAGTGFGNGVIPPIVEFGWLSLLKADKNGRSLNCSSTDYPISAVPLALAKENIQIPMRDSLIYTVNPGSITSEPYYFRYNRNCAATISCNEIKIVAPNSVCTTVPVIVHARRNTGCTLPVQWIINGNNIGSEKLNDSTLSIRFIDNGKYKIIAKINNNCESFTDTLEMNVSVLAKSILDLGPDTVICPGNQIILNAHKGYFSYLWQDGSSDSTFKVTNAGTYSVTTTDACGGIYKDTVIVNPHSPISFGIDGRHVKCNNDTLHLDAPSGFMNYSWTPHYNINSDTGQHIVVNPAIDTLYFVRAEKTPGCFAYDTIRLKVNHSIPISLGTDKSFCKGDSVILDAGSGFVSYQWSDGSITQQITKYTSGRYSVMGLSNNGCRSYDTVNLIVFPNPVVKLDHDTTLCAGTIRTLDPGDFVSYAWNNGSNQRTQLIQTTGIYKVAVIDINGCKAIDSVNINTTLPLPAAFLPSDTTICSYGTLSIHASKKFKNYLWNTNVRAPEITINQPGQYWLQVTDYNNCSGRDSIIVVPKNCMEGFYVPTAFTPNNDGHNDTFRPMLFGNIKEYHFTVYNRWGEMIFDTNIPAKGWDGSVNGLKQDSNVYIWICKYQFEGSEKQFQKGTVVLIK